MSRWRSLAHPNGDGARGWCRRLTIRGDGHDGRPEVMAWCEINDVDYVLGLPGNATLSRLVEVAADDVRVRRAEAQAALTTAQINETVRKYLDSAALSYFKAGDFKKAGIPE